MKIEIEIKENFNVRALALKLLK